jgi:RHH-type transcriptional regulator, rel operon repressor / antitoxin RelB
MSTTMTLRLDDSVKIRLDKLAEATHRTKSFLAAEAIENYIQLNEWQISETLKAIEEADKGDFASEEKANAFFEKWS